MNKNKSKKLAASIAALTLVAATAVAADYVWVNDCDCGCTAWYSAELGECDAAFQANNAGIAGWNADLGGPGPEAAAAYWLNKQLYDDCRAAKEAAYWSCVSHCS